MFLRLVAATGAVAGISTGVSAQEGGTEIVLDGAASGWEGTSPTEIDGETNPTLRVQAGETYTLTWTNVDGTPHNVVISDADGNTIERTEIVEEEGQTQSLEFEATAEMSTYYCEVHPDSMRGEITAGDGTADGEEAPAISELFSAGEMTGDQHTEPVETTASGAALFGLDETGEELHYALLVAEIEQVLQAHIHLGGPDENGDVVAFLFGLQDEQGAFTGPLEQGVSGSGVLAEGTITAENLVGPLEGGSLEDLLDQLRSEAAYVNVHTEQNPGGEIRGQIASAETVNVELTERVVVDETLQADTRVTLNVNGSGETEPEPESGSKRTDDHEGDDHGGDDNNSGDGGSDGNGSNGGSDDDDGY